MSKETEMTKTINCYVQNGDLYEYATGEYIRPATAAEAADSEAAAEIDGGVGVIEVTK